MSLSQAFLPGTSLEQAVIIIIIIIIIIAAADGWTRASQETLRI